MKPFFEDAQVTLHQGDAGTVLRELAPGSVQTCITSPPYFGLRDYGAGEEEVGREATPAAYVARLVVVMREVRRVLADDGTLWLNLGDSYNSTASNQNGTGLIDRRGGAVTGGAQARGRVRERPAPDLKPKDLIGTPWRVAFALQDDGWWLRSDIIWHKPNPMPESVTDRPTRSHEYVFLLTKRADYFYDAEAVREPPTMRPQRRTAPKLRGQHGVPGQSDHHGYLPARGAVGVDGDPAGRNKRSVWSVCLRPFMGAHFAVFPEALVEPCLLAGSRLGDTVLDPFCGSGTVGAVARRHGRGFVGIDLNPGYLALAAGRVAQLSLWGAAS